MKDARTREKWQEEGTTEKRTAPLTEKRENDEQVVPAPHTGDR
jgi:hypothetical protein